MADLFLGRPRSRRYPKFNIRRDIPRASRTHATRDERVPSEYADQPVQVLSRRHLIRNKKASGRLQDLADVEALERNAD